MRRRLVVLVALCGMSLVPLACAQERSAEKAADSPASQDEGRLEIWKWANFVLLAGVLGYLIGKNARPFFTARSRHIREEMVRASDLKKEADQRAAEIDRRLANLEADIAALRAASQQEAENETRRMRQQSEAEIAKVREHAEQEIASAGKAARMELKRYSAELAVGLAEQKLRARMTPEAQDALVRGFVHDLDRSPVPAQTT